MHSIIMLPFLIIHLFLDGTWLMCGSKNTSLKKRVFEKDLTMSSNFINYSKGDGPCLVTFIYLLLGHLHFNGVWLGVAP